jgi:hypothetical protein
MLIKMGIFRFHEPMRKHNLLSILLTLIVGYAFAQDLTQKANNFLATLTPELKSKTLFPLKDEERFNFNFVPLDRQGPTFNDFNEQQKTAAIALLRASVSEQGYKKAVDIMELEKALIIIEKQAPDNRRRDPLNYHFCIFGTPSNSGPWGWRFEGHHISMNFASNEGKIISSTPSFFGSNPGIVPNDVGIQQGKQALKQESALALTLINSLNSNQLKIARFSEETPADIFTSNNRKATNLEPKGITFKTLSADQKKTFLQLLDVFVKNYEFGFSKTLMAKIERAGIDNLSFAWAGGLKYGEPHYYRIQGPMLLIEYDNIQTNASHVHTVVRDLTNDFAEDILREHYLQDHKEQ